MPPSSTGPAARSRHGWTHPAQHPPDRAAVLLMQNNLPSLRLGKRRWAHRPTVKLCSAIHASLGLELAGEDRPSLILLDLPLPDIPGPDVLERLQRHPA